MKKLTKTTIKFLTALILTFFVNQFLLANTNYVGTAGAPTGNYYTDIQSAADATAVGGLVLVSNGVYDTGGAVMPYGSLELTNRVVILANITIRSISGPQSTIIVGGEGISGGSGTGAVRCVYFDETDAVLSGFTLSNGHTLTYGNETWDKSGGGALMGYGSIMTNCIITGCSSENGGGVLIYLGGTIDNCKIFNNQSDFGGGAYLNSFGLNGTIKNSVFFNNSAEISGGAIRMEKGLIINSVFTNNSSKSTGGGLDCYDGTIRNCKIENNSASMESGGAGGGVSCFRNMNLFNCEIINNSAYSGGGVDCHQDYGSIFSNCVISGNLASYSGGGVDFGKKSELLNCLISDNLSSNFGGGIHFSYGGTIKNCTVVSNSAQNGGGVYCELYGSNLNSIIYYNIADNGTNYYNSGTEIVYEYSCAWPIITNGVGNISDNPNFVNPDANNWRLQSTSPCINSGTNAYAPMPYDLAGNPRIIGGTVDMGCYEVVPEPCLFIIYNLLFIIYYLRK